MEKLESNLKCFACFIIVDFKLRHVAAGSVAHNSPISCTIAAAHLEVEARVRIAVAMGKSRLKNGAEQKSEASKA